MNNKVNYTVVGLLVLTGMVLISVFSYWMLKPSSQEKTKEYNIYFKESVLGLSLNAPVKFRGVSVGKVSNIRINPKDTQEVEVRVSILKTTPIKTDTVAKLTPQGITGLSYINLSMGSNSSQKLTTKEGEKYPSIKTTPSLLKNLEVSLGDVSANLLKTLSETQKLLGRENQEQVTDLLKRTAHFMQKMERLLDDNTINHFHSAVKNLDSSTAKFDKLLPKVDDFVEKSSKWEDKVSVSLKSIQKSYLTIQGTMSEVKKAVARGDFNIKGVADEVVPNINDTMLQMQQLMIRLEDSLNKYDRSPRDILFKEEEVKKGPGEK